MICDGLLKQLSVLFVEDEQSLLALLVSTIGEEFASYDSASNGKEALGIVSKNLPDIIISDITMPQMDGLEMAEHIHVKHPEVPIIILSAYSDKEKLLGAIDAGISKYFIKPFDPDELLSYLCILAQKMKKANHVDLYGAFTYDIRNNKLLCDGEVVKLTTRELDFIEKILKSPNNTLSNEEIRDFIGKDNKRASGENLRVFIRRFREKTDKHLIQSLSRQGYVLSKK